MAGLEALGESSDVVVVVDVLSFSTCVEVAVSRGAEIVPVPARDPRAGEIAREKNAELAGRRGEARYSLSPATFLTAPRGARIALPSPNGAALSSRPIEARVLCGCLRNAAAVARAARELGRRVAVIPAGERWGDGSLRPCLEDLFGAGAILEGLGDDLSPEARAANAVFRGMAPKLDAVLENCASGRELRARGFASDVTLAAQVDISRAVPVLDAGVFRPLPIP